MQAESARGVGRGAVPAPDRLRDRLVRGTVALPALCWSALASLYVAIQFLCSTRGRSLSEVFLRVDGGAYVSIATDGYSYRATDLYPLVAWFPVFPLAIRGVSAVLGDAVLSAVLVSAACGLSATVLFWNWMRRTGVDDRTRVLALAVGLLYAYGWFVFGVIYSDAMFLVLAILAFLLVEDDRPVWAFLVCGAATAVRPTGPALALGILVLVLERSGALRVPPGATGWVERFRVPLRLDASRLRPALLAAPLSLAGVVAYSSYLGARFGEPLLWLRVQEHWSQGPSEGPASWFKLHMLAILVREHDPSFIATAVPQTLLVLAAIAAIPFVGRRFGWGYAAYSAASVFIVAFGTNELVGAGRYLIGVFPFAALLAGYLSTRRTAATVWLAVSAVALVAHMVFFARGAYLT